jgi:hypothetical protein
MTSWSSSLTSIILIPKCEKYTINQLKNTLWILVVLPTSDQTLHTIANESGRTNYRSFLLFNFIQVSFILFHLSCICFQFCYTSSWILAFNYFTYFQHLSSQMFKLIHNLLTFCWALGVIGSSMEEEEPS